MSVTTTSGSTSLDQRQQPGEVVGRSHQLQSVLLGDELLDSLAQEGVVLGQHHPDLVHGDNRSRPASDQAGLPAAASAPTGVVLAPVRPAGVHWPRARSDQTGRRMGTEARD